MITHKCTEHWRRIVFFRPFVCRDWGGRSPFWFAYTSAAFLRGEYKYNSDWLTISLRSEGLCGERLVSVLSTWGSAIGGNRWHHFQTGNYYLWRATRVDSLPVTVSYICKCSVSSRMQTTFLRRWLGPHSIGHKYWGNSEQTFLKSLNQSENGWLTTSSPSILGKRSQYFSVQRGNSNKITPFRCNVLAIPWPVIHMSNIVLKRLVVYTMEVTSILVNVNERLLISLNGMIKLCWKYQSICLLVTHAHPYHKLHVYICRSIRFLCAIYITLILLAYY